MVLLLFMYKMAMAGPTLDRYGGYYDYTSTPTYKFGIPDPRVNDFEYRSIEDDVFAILKSSGILTGCGKYKAAFLLIELRADPYFTYADGEHRSTEPVTTIALQNIYNCDESKDFEGLQDYHGDE